MLHKSPAQRVALAVFGLVLAGFFLFPTYWMFTTALKTPAQILSPAYDLVPLSATLKNFVNAITKPGFTTFLTNSLTVTLGAVAFALVAGLLAAVPLARLRFRGRKGFIMLVLVAQLAPLEALFVPMYLIMRDADLLNSLWGLLLVYVAFTLPFTVWTLRGFVKGIPIELEEAAMVDGCGRWGVFTRVTLPLLGPGLVATSVFSFITAWNEFLYALVFMREKDKQTLPVWLSSFKTAFGTDWGGIMAASVIYAIPALIFFLLVQRKLVSGSTAGAVKG
ncbi:carbohydrate ABC transporter permease [Actinokineospora globicatena]|uniref:Sugar ABC transporter permease n=1 Tax=Actinokineospora globicatena TaxID=103729 RepID=A0A9W6QJC3_9PSEU|nr:carbohydrate ABC transporter permease [Actinokineospora globicatena]MCP2306826.1 N,N'-diacetylchitobiose transport system permease protein [Actinokineospora globicatena]GLW82267.1 sugar ABC transporter permease [Actinokineospora globicatena]GLW89140.1 sugar ABC transporter permease [Actinokineospora globicatena]GLW89188.1 sugar ABC transporter permease [Actinokineospora globicatena]